MNSAERTVRDTSRCATQKAEQRADTAQMRVWMDAGQMRLGDLWFLTAGLLILIR